ncbi:hypothetical protein P1P92_36030 [Streptomyces ipomoeae]|nr:hypothetical protein [Streptomyces ipomoeae]MDX2937756.1 hypothetical protein [Streptomyces ipomoeae]
MAQLSKRWGSRYHHIGKTIWAEQCIADLPARDEALLTGVWDSADL